MQVSKNLPPRTSTIHTKKEKKKKEQPSLLLNILPRPLVFTIARPHLFHSIVAPAARAALRAARQARAPPLLRVHGLEGRGEAAVARGRRGQVLAAAGAAAAHDEAAVAVGAALVVGAVFGLAVEDRLFLVRGVAFFVFDELGAEGGLGRGVGAVERRVGVLCVELFDRLAFGGVDGGGFGDDGGDGGVGDGH